MIDTKERFTNASPAARHSPQRTTFAAISRANNRRRKVAFSTKHPDRTIRRGCLSKTFAPTFPRNNGRNRDRLDTALELIQSETLVGEWIASRDKPKPSKIDFTPESPRKHSRSESNRPNRRAGLLAEGGFDGLLGCLIGGQVGRRDVGRAAVQEPHVDLHAAGAMARKYRSKSLAILRKS